MHKTILLALPAAALLAPSLAQAASLDACGDIHLQARAECELVTRGCDVECTPVAVEAACAGALQVECAGACDLDADIGCTAQCEAGCEAECLVDPGSFECAAGCNAECDSSCEARCNDSECFAACEANCDAECEASCEVVPPQVDCVASCEASCEGSCRAEANLDCQLDCQSEAFLECQAELTGGCQADCSELGGALFCDGHYVDHANNMQECIDAIHDVLNGEVEGSAELSCRGGECNFSSEGILACNVGDPADRDAPIGLAIATLIGIALVGRRRR